MLCAHNKKPLFWRKIGGRARRGEAGARRFGARATRRIAGPDPSAGSPPRAEEVLKV